MAPKPPSKAQASRTPNGSAKSAKVEKPKDYSSHGVTDNDIFMLPSSDFQLLGVLTVVAAVVRLFRIYQPSSVVFDEVQ
jgi:dolichyl-phosphate-mannose-protein mannosyltransferase